MSPAPSLRRLGAGRPRAGWLSLLAVPLVAFALLAGTVQARSASAVEPPIVGGIRAKWDELGGYSFLGRPLDAEHPTFDGAGRRQNFEYGVVSWHPRIGAFAVWGAILEQWQVLGAERWGYPITDESGTPDGAGRYNHFRRIGGDDRSIYWTPATGAQPIFGDFRAQWAERGWERSSLGYPITGEFEPQAASGIVRQNFQHGFMTHAFGIGSFIQGYPTPVRTHHIVVLRCKYSDSDAEPYTDQYYREIFTQAGRGKGGYADYVEDQTYKRTAITGEVHGWFTMGITLAEAHTIDPDHGTARQMRYDACVDAARDAGYTAPAGSTVVAAANEVLDGWGATGQVWLDSVALFPNFVFHELTHGIGIWEHSFSDDTSVLRGGAPGEYDDEWDEMSAMHDHTVPSKYYGPQAMGLNALNREKLGAFVAADIRTITPRRGTTQDIEVEALEAPLTTVPQMLRINAGGRQLWVELRNRTGYSSAMSTPSIVLIHEQVGATGTLLRNHTGSRDPLQTVTVGGVTISVLRQSGTTATIRVSAS